MKVSRAVVTFAVGCLVAAMMAIIPAMPAAAALGLTVPASLTAAPNVARPISGVTLDAGGLSSVQIALSVDHGTLSMSTTTGLSFVPGSGSGNAQVQFTANGTDAQNALSTLAYTPDNGYIGPDTLTYNTGPGGGLYNADNGHFYEFIDVGSDITWTAAKVAAAARTFNGLAGYLATVTSQAEQDFIAGKLQGQGWLAASDDSAESNASESHWVWATGPEEGEEFWEGTFSGYSCGVGTCSPVGGRYNNWADGEPNDAGGENYSHFLLNGEWNDYPDDAGIEKYLVEYGGMPGDPALVDTDTTSITVATTVPDPPTSVDLTPGNTQIEVEWSAPGYNGGAAIDYYLVEYSTDGGTNWASWPTTTSTSTTITGLTNGTVTQVRVSAHNSAGYSTTTTPVSTTPATVPTAVQGLAASVANTQSVITWNAPTSDGGSAITGYRVESSTDGTNFTTAAASTTSPYTLSPLTNGTTYTVRVTPINAMGDGASATTTVVPGTTPGTPATPVLTVGNQQLGVSWSAPSSGGHAIDYYVVEYSTNSGSSWTALANTALTAVTITSLTNGTPVQVRVTAHNDIGFGSPSTAATATPATTSTSPQSLAASVANTQSVITWNAPTSDGGSAITGYLVESSTDGTNFTTAAASTTSPYTLSPLTNGTTYTVRVTPINGIGNGTSASTTVTPGTTPGTPATPVLTVGNQQLGVSWSAPSSGGHAIDYYVVEYSTNNGSSWTALANTALTAVTITSLTNGTPVQVRVTAHNDIGFGSPSTAATATPATTPSAPQALELAPSDGQVVVSWGASASNGGDAITGYRVEYSSDGTNFTTAAANTASPYTVSPLVNGTTYTIRVSAINGIGAGTSATETTTVGGLPTAPQNLVATSESTQAALTWSAPTTDGGLPITGYRVEHSTDGVNWTVFTSSATSPTTLTGLTNGTTYSVRVSALNSQGAGPSISTTVTPLGTPSAPQDVTVTKTPVSATVTWNVPTDSGGTPITGYVLEYRLAGGTWTTASTSAISPQLVDGLTPGTDYEIRLVAKNIVGNGTVASAAFTTDTPPTPGVPAPIHIEPDGTVTDVPAFQTGDPAQITAATPTGDGSWSLTPDGGVFTAGDASFFGSMGGQSLNAPAVGIAPTPTGGGYFVVGSDGGVFAFGDAQFQGSMGGVPLNAPIKAIAPSCTANGYYLVGSDGGVFAFGDAGFHGSMAGVPLNGEMLGIVDACGKQGYWTFARDGGVFSFGDAGFYGSLGSSPPPGGVIAMVSAPDGLGYWLIGADKKAYGFGSVA